MPLPATYDDALLLEQYLTPQADPASPQAMFGLPAAAPTTNFFGGGSQVGGGYSFKRGMAVDGSPIQQRAAALKMQQRAEEDTNKLFQYIGLVDATKPDYLQKRQQLQMAFPYAVMNPAGKHAIEVLDFNYTQSQKDPNRGFVDQASMAGVTPEEIAAHTVNGIVDRAALGNLAHQRKLEERPEKHHYSDKEREIKDIEKAYEMATTMMHTNEAHQLRDLWIQKQKELYPERYGIQPGGQPSAARPTSSAAPAARDLRSLVNQYDPK